MSEPTPEVRKYDDDTPESVVVQYGQYLDSMEEAGEAQFAATYTMALLKLRDLFESLDRPEGLTFDQIRDAILPATFDESDMDPESWCDRMRLAPAHLLQRGAPGVGAVSGEYVKSLIFAVLSNSSRHGVECMSFCSAEDGASCIHSDICPAKSINHIFVQAASDSVTSLVISDDEEDGPQIQRAKEAVRVMRESLISYGITTQEIFDSQFDAVWYEDMRVLNEIEAA